MARAVVVAVFACLAVCAPAIHAADGDATPPLPNKRGPVVAGNLTVNPRDVIAVYRPNEQQGVVVLVGRPGQLIQAIVFKDAREATAVFNELWSNEDITKNPGDEDARPLTRMLPKTAEQKNAVLILNLQRVLAMTWESDHRSINIYFDKPASQNSDDEHHHLEIGDVRDDNDSIMAAYKLCILPK